MICVLKVVHGPATGKKCWLKRDQRVTIGRLTSADFSISSDAHMSRHHLMVEGVGDSFRLRDVGSSNGTFVNDFRVNVVELCDGDLIKAGSSVFEVGLEADSGLSLQAASEEGKGGVAIPSRTLGGQEMEALEEMTMRYEIAAEETAPIPQAVVADPRPQFMQAATVGSTLGSGGHSESFLADPAPAENQRRHGVQPLEDGLAAFFAEFESSSGQLWQQCRRDGRSPGRILDRLMEADAAAAYSLIINRSQIDGMEKGTLDFVLSTRESRSLTETLCLVESRKPGNVIEFYKRCLGKDAAICVVSPEPLSPEWLQNAIDSLSYPSLFGDVVARSSSRAQELALGTHFILFEPHAGGELRLLRGC